MKKLISILVVAVLCIMAAQIYAQQFGIKAGLNLSNQLMKDDDDVYSDDFKMNPGFHVGPTVGFPLSDVFSFETGLLLSTKGFKFSESRGTPDYPTEYKVKQILYYLDVPLEVKGVFDVGNIKLYESLGGYLGYGISGKSKYESTYNGDTETDEWDIEWGSDPEEDYLKRLDFGLAFGAGVIIKSFQIGLGYNLGLANISSYTDGGTKISNRVLMISVGYTFPGVEESAQE